MVNKLKGNKIKKQSAFISIIAIVPESPKVLSKFLSKLQVLLSSSFYNFEIVLIENGSTQIALTQISEILKTQQNTRVLRLSKKYDMESAIFAGLDSAIGDYIVITLPGEDPPHLILSMINKLKRGCDIVYGISKKGFNEPFYAKVGRLFFYKYIKHFLKLELPPNTTHFTILTRRFANALTKTRTRYRHIKLTSLIVGFKKDFLFYEPLSYNGSVKMNGLLETINLALDIIFSYSKHPLRFVSWLAISAAFLNFIYVCYILSIFFLKNQVAEGWTTLSLQNAIMFFLAFIVLTALSENMGRVLEETRNQPTYHIMEELNSGTSAILKKRKNIIKK